MPADAITGSLAAATRARLTVLVVSLATAAHPSHAADAPSWVEVNTAQRDRLEEVAAGGFLWDHGAGTGPVSRAYLSADTDRRLRRLGWDLRRVTPQQTRGSRRSADVTAGLVALGTRAARGGIQHLGASREGRPIEAIWLGQPPGSGAIVHRVLGAHHGDEPISADLVLSFAERLVQGDGLDEAVTALLDASTIWLVAAVNPDGLDSGSRFNAAGVDLNRNYGHMWSKQAFASGSAPFSEPETEAIRVHGLYNRPLGGLALHSGAENIGYVWNHSTTPTADRPLLARLAHRYAELTEQDAFWVTNGAQWYVSQGDCNDWAYGEHGTLDFTVEVSEHKSPAADRAEVLINAHTEAMLQWLSIEPHHSGRVMDTAGSGLDARVSLVDIGGTELGWVRTDPVSGVFHLYRTQGATSPPLSRIEVSSYGFARTSIPSKADLLDVVLQHDETTHTPTPTVLFGGSGQVELPVFFDGLVTLTQPGSDRVVRSVRGRTLELEGLPSGLWNMELPDGSVLPRIIASADASLSSLDQLEPLGDGARAFLLTGPKRPLCELPIARVHEPEAWSRICPPDGHMDLVVVSGTAHLVWSDWPHTVAPKHVGASPQPQGCGCAQRRAPTPLSVVLWSLALAWSRRR
jgi:hypothetical protein